MLVSCSICQHFMPDSIGIGQCGQLEQYLLKKPSAKAIRLALIDLGNSSESNVFWGGSSKDRECKKFDKK